MPDTRAQDAASNAVFPAVLRRHVHACATLAAFGSGAGLPLLLDELAWHCTSGRTAGGLAGVALGVGALLGLWLPRRLLRRRLEADMGMAEGRGTVEFAFAAALTGGLLLLLALLWTALHAGTGGLEAYRSALVAHVLLPAGPGHVLLLGPVLTGVVALGLLSTLVLVAFQGWHGLVSGPGPQTSGLVFVLVVALTAGAVLSGTALPDSAARFVSLLFAYLAGVVAVAWPVLGSGSSGPPAARPNWQQIAGPLLWAGVAALLASGALVLALDDSRVHLDTSRAAITCACAGAAALLGMIAANGWLRVRGSAGPAVPVCVVMAAFASLLPGNAGPVLGVAGPAWRLMLVAGPAAACVLLVTRGLVRIYRRPQPASAKLGGVLAAGMIAGCAASGAWAAPVHAHRASLLIAALSIAGAVGPWVAGRGMKTRTRGAAVLTAAAAMAGVVWEWSPDERLEPPRAGLTEAAPLCKHLVAERPESTCLHLDSSGAAREHDWGGARFDGLCLHGDAPGPEAAQRFMRRIDSSLRPGGYLMLALPAEHLALAAFRRARGRPLYLVTLRGAGEYANALILGPDPRAWLERWVPGEYAIEIRAVDNLADLRRATDD